MQAADLDQLRGARRHKTHAGRSSEIRSEFQRDKDRLLYSTFFRRLAHITQVIGPHEGYAFHNRLTHVLKVAQVGRRLSQKLLEATPGDTIYNLGGLSPDVVETAALAHDLGHPPFGHIAEKVLDKLAVQAGIPDGFEGNAQSFRVVTKIEVRETEPSRPGLNLSRATLNAILKYPWMRGAKGKKSEKWGAYDAEEKDFRFARSNNVVSDAKCLEAELMDWADDIAYSVHDLEDFFRAGRIPLDRLSRSIDEQVDFINGVYVRKNIRDRETRRIYEEVFAGVVSLFPLEPYSGRRDQKAVLRMMASHEIAKFEENTSITKAGLEVDRRIRAEVELLKQLVWHYVIEDPGLATQQHGQRKIITDLFEFYLVAFKKGNFNIFPPLVRDELKHGESPKRAILDLIASYTEKQAFEMHQRLTGEVVGLAFAAPC